MPRRPKYEVIAELFGVPYITTRTIGAREIELVIDAKCPGCKRTRQVKLTRVHKQISEGEYHGLCPSCTQKK